MNTMKIQKDRILKEELPRSVSAQDATGDQWRNNSRKNEGMEPKQKQYPVVDVTGGKSKVRCYKKQFSLIHGPNIPGSYANCSLQHRALLLSPVTSTTGYCFCFGSIPSFFLELFLHWSPVAYCTPTDLGSSPFSVLSFCLFILFTGFSRQEYCNGLLFSFLVEHS